MNIDDNITAVAFEAGKDDTYSVEWDIHFSIARYVLHKVSSEEC